MGPGTANRGRRRTRAIFASARYRTPSGGADVLALYENGPTRELRTFRHHRHRYHLLRQRRRNTLDDRGELGILDANNSDSLTKLTDVAAAADFDGDTYSNGTELAAGAAREPCQFPGQRVTLVATSPDADELGQVPGLIHVVRTGDATAA